MPRSFALALATSFVVAACGGTAQPAATATRPITTTGGAATAAPTPTPNAAPATAAVVELEKGGSFTISFRSDKAPNTVANFAKKARAGDYAGTTFHRVVPGFVAQGGDPYSKTGGGQVGTGGGTQPTELNDLPFALGAVGVARGTDIKISNASQFFVTTGDAPHLNGQYTNFGQITLGMDVVQGIKIGDKIKTIRVS